MIDAAFFDRDPIHSRLFIPNLGTIIENHDFAIRLMSTDLCNSNF